MWRADEVKNAVESEPGVKFSCAHVSKVAKTGLGTFMIGDEKWMVI